MPIFERAENVLLGALASHQSKKKYINLDILMTAFPEK